MNKKCHSKTIEAKIHDTRKGNYPPLEDARRLFGIGAKKKDQNDIDPVVDESVVSFVESASAWILNHVFHFLGGSDFGIRQLTKYKSLYRIKPFVIK